MPGASHNDFPRDHRLYIPVLNFNASKSHLITPGMANAEVDLGILALLVALIALVVSLSQLLSQVFATAEGSRRCGQAVIGHWSSLTTWKWRWSEQRFETKFASPEIYLGVPLEWNPKTTMTSAFAADEDDHHHHQFKYDGRDPELAPKPAELLGMDDHALLPFYQPSHPDGWMGLVSALQDLTRAYPYKTVRRCGDSTSWPGLRLRYRSWDSMPADVAAPVATTTLGDVAIIARRLGMSWKTFDPDKGILAAEGNGQSLTSVEMRTFGLTLRYLRRDSRASDGRFRRLVNASKSKEEGATGKPLQYWTRETDCFMFGIFPGDKALGLPDVQVTTYDDVQRLFGDVFKLTRKGEPNYWRDFFPGKTWYGQYEVNELRNMICPVLRDRRSRTTTALCIGRYGADIFTFGPSRACFPEFVGDRLKTRPSVHLRHLLSLFVDFPADRDRMQPPEPEWLNQHHDGHDYTTQYFQHLNQKYPGFFWHLIRAHFSQAPVCSFDSRHKNPPRNLHFADSGHTWRAEQVTLQWDCLPQYVSFMQEESGCKDPTQIEEAWITLWFRAICWAACHNSDPQYEKADYLPAQWYGSQLPVYLL